MIERNTTFQTAARKTFTPSGGKNKNKKDKQYLFLSYAIFKEQLTFWLGQTYPDQLGLESSG